MEQYKRILLEKFDMTKGTELTNLRGNFKPSIKGQSSTLVVFMEKSAALIIF